MTLSDSLFTVAIISFNVKEKLRTCIESIFYHLPDIPICIWDNGSTDGTKEMITSDYPNVQYHYSPENLYFARGCNELVTRCITKYVLLMNADIKLIDASTACIADYLELRYNVIAASPSVRDHGLLRHMSSGIISPFMCIARDSFWGAAVRRGTNYRKKMGENIDAHSIFDVEKITNCCCMIRRRQFLDMGGFCTQQLLYWTEEEFAVRVMQYGMRQSVFGESIVEHDHGSSTKKLPFRLVRAIYLHDRITYMHSLFGTANAAIVEAALLRPRIWKSLAEYYWYLSSLKTIAKIKRTIVEYKVP